MKRRFCYFFIICILVGISSFAYFVYLKSNKPETARLTTEGQDIEIISNTYSTSRNFIFQDKTGETITTLSVTNPAISFPSYRIVKGNTHDWLVVTKLETWGTGLRYDKDEWYIIGLTGAAKIVLSYKSEGLEVPGDSGSRNMYLSTDAIEGGDKNDTIVDIKSTNKECSRKEDGSDKDCRESLSTSHYVWSSDKGEFTLK